MYSVFLHLQIKRLCIFSDDNLLDRLAKIAANPFHNWSYSSNQSPMDISGIPLVSAKDSIPITDVVSSQNIKIPDTIPIKPNLKRGRKRIHTVTTSEHEPQRTAIDFKNNKEKEKDNRDEKESKDQIQLQELYYATMEGDKNLILKERRSPLYFKVCLKLLYYIGIFCNA